MNPRSGMLPPYAISHGWIVNQGTIRYATVCETSRTRVKVTWKNSVREMSRWVTPATSVSDWLVSPNHRLLLPESTNRVTILDGLRLSKFYRITHYRPADR